jgi:Kef-type K+ transport system membrane component KefB
MTEFHVDYTILVLLTGATLLTTMAVRLVCDRLRIAPVVGYLVLGFCIRIVDRSVNLLEHGGYEILHFLATIGVITLLFRIGLSSELRKLLGQLKRASMVWVGDVCTSGFLGYGFANFILGFDMSTSLIVGAAMTATSVGISVGVWQHAGALNSSSGDMLLDVAELDDISAIVIMGLLFSMLPMLQQGNLNLLAPVIETTAVFVLKLLAFAFFCYLFARFNEHPFLSFFLRHEKQPIAMLAVIGMGFIIAALAGEIGFSVAIGAFFAGLVFSGDPDAVRMEGSFMPLYAFFSPFFFIGVGLDVNPEAFTSALWPGLILIVGAIIGKVLANGLPSLFFTTKATAITIGLSMVPRAEIAMIIMQRGMQNNYISEKVFAAMVMVSAVTCIFTPLVVQPMLKKWPPS